MERFNSIDTVFKGRRDCVRPRFVATLSTLGAGEIKGSLL